MTQKPINELKNDVIEKANKPIHVKPSLYAFYFESLKVIALNYGYNLVLHGSMNRDLDLIAIPWQDDVLNHEEMIKEFADELGGNVMGMTHEQKHCFPHGRLSYVINLNRGEKLPSDDFTDPMYYIDISVIQPVFTTNPEHTKAMVSQSALSAHVQSQLLTKVEQLKAEFSDEWIEKEYPSEIGQTVIMEENASYDDVRNRNYHRRQGAKSIRNAILNKLTEK